MSNSFNDFSTFPSFTLKLSLSRDIPFVAKVSVMTAPAVIVPFVEVFNTNFHEAFLAA